MSDAPRDANQVPSLLAVDDVTGLTRPVLTDADGNILIAASVVGGNVSGPVSSTDNAIVRWNGTAGDTVQNSGIIIDDSDNVTGVTSLVIDSAAGLDITPGSDTNTDLITLNVTGTPTLAWLEASDVFTLNKGLTLSAGSFTGTVFTHANGGIMTLGTNDSTGHVIFTSGQTLNSASGTDIFLRIAPTVNETGTAGYNALEVDVTETATGSGTKNLLALQVANVDKFTVNNAGAITTGSWGTTLALGSNNLTMTGSIASTGSRVTKGWFTDLEVTNAPTLNGVAIPSISSSNTLTNKTISGSANTLSNIAVSSLANGTAGELITWSAASAPTTVAAGTSGQILTSNGAGAAPTFQTASGGTVRRYMNPTLVLSNLTTVGTAPTNSAGFNGIQCSVTTATQSCAKIVLGDSGNIDFYDKDPEFTFSGYYSAGITTGSGDFWCGETGNVVPPTATQTTKSMFVMIQTTAGTPKWTGVNADGTTNTNTDFSGTPSNANYNYRIRKTSTTNIKFWVDYTLKATHTTNLPSGDVATDNICEFGVGNDGGDSTTRTGIFSFLEIILDAANS